MSARLLLLPQEIKDKIWELAYGHQDFHLYRESFPGVDPVYSDHDECQACKSLYVARYTTGNNASEYTVRMLERLKSPQAAYNRMLDAILLCRDVYNEALKLFQSTLTVHLKSPEALAWFRHSAPASLRQNVQNVVICVHFGADNHALWFSRILEINAAFPNIKRVLIRYHMRPPISYDNLLDAFYLSVAILALPEPLDVPNHVSKAADPGVPPELQPGLSLETAYIEEQSLFEADWLGSVSTADAIDEHTALMSDLFHDPEYVTDVRHLLRQSKSLLDNTVAQAYRPNRYPLHALAQSFHEIGTASVPQQSLLQIARRHEKPWFEKLMRRRIVEVWEQRYGFGRSDVIQAFLATLPVGGGVEEIIQALVEHDELADIFGLNEE